MDAHCRRAPGTSSRTISESADSLLARDRRRPVVAVSPDAMSYGPATRPNALADQLVGLAHVFNITTGPATFELTERLGRQLTVYEGAVRVYWPGLTLDSDPYLHRSWLGRTVDLINHRRRDGGDRSVGFGRHLLSLIGDVASLRISPDPLAASLRREMEASRRAAERAEWSDGLPKRPSRTRSRRSSTASRPGSRSWSSRRWCSRKRSANSR